MKLFKKKRMLRNIIYNSKVLLHIHVPVSTHDKFTYVHISSASLSKCPINSPGKDTVSVWEAWLATI